MMMTMKMKTTKMKMTKTTSKFGKRIKTSLQKQENRITLIFFIVTMIVAISPLISRYCINGHDIEYHLLWIESLKEGILIGRPFLKVNTLFFGGAGYASSMFYSDLFMHIPALLRVFHVSIGKSFHIYKARTRCARYNSFEERIRNKELYGIRAR